MTKEARMTKPEADSTPFQGFHLAFIIRHSDFIRTRVFRHYVILSAPIRHDPSAILSAALTRSKSQ